MSQALKDPRGFAVQVLLVLLILLPVAFWILLPDESEITDLHAGKTSRWNRISAVEARHAYLNS